MRKVYLKANLNLCRYLCLNLLNVNSKYFIHCAFLFRTWRGGNFTSRGTFPVSGTLQRVQLWSRWLHHLVCTFYRQQGKVIFSEACVILSRVGREADPPLEGDPPSRDHPSGGRPPGQRPPSGHRLPPPRQTPWKKHAPDRKWHHTPLIPTSSGDHCSSPYASYRNVFLFVKMSLGSKFTSP